MSEQVISTDFENFLVKVFSEAAYTDFYGDTPLEELNGSYMMSRKTDIRIIRLIRYKGNSVFLIALKRTVVAVIAICAVFFGLKIFAPETYAKITEFTFSLYKEYIEIYFDKTDDSYVCNDIDSVSLEYIPHGFHLESEKESDTRKKYSYSNAEGAGFSVDFLISDNTTVYFDTERGTVKDVDINGFKGTVWIGDNPDEGVSGFLKKGNLSVYIYGDIEEKELTRIIKGID